MPLEALVALVAVLTLVLAGCAEILEGLDLGTTDRSTPDDGVREALRVGTGRAVDLLGARDGFLGDPSVAIPVPDDLRDVARALRAIGLEDDVDEFRVSLNRAAEAAVPLAKPVFLDAVRAMTVEDAWTILRGDGREATDYFRGRTEARLGELFRPTVAEQLDAVGATRAFRRLADRVERIPLVDVPALDLEGYVTTRALDALFDALGREEQKIRDDPVARTTALLRKYFGRDG